MQFSWRKYDTGWGELLCFVLAWVIGLAGLWFDYAGRHANTGGDKVAVIGDRFPAPVNFD